MPLLRCGGGRKTVALHDVHQRIELLRNGLLLVTDVEEGAGIAVLAASVGVVVADLLRRLLRGRLVLMLRARHGH